MGERRIAASDGEAVDGIPVAGNKRSKLQLPHHSSSLCQQWVDQQHSEGRTVTNSKAQNFIRITCNIKVLL